MTSYKTQADSSDRGIIAKEGGTKPTFVKEAAEFWTIIMGEHADFIFQVLSGMRPPLEARPIPERTE